MRAGIRTKITIGELEILRSPLIEIISSRHKYLSRLNVTLPDPKSQIHQAVLLNDPVEVQFGYRDQKAFSWKGEVRWKKPGTIDQTIIGAVEEGDRKLEDTKIIQSWINDTPAAIIKWAIRQSGLMVGRVDNPHGVTFPRYVASNIPVWQVARQCEQTCQNAFGIDMSRWTLWKDASGKVNWGDFDEQGETFTIGTAAGLIKHHVASDKAAFNMVESFLLPGMKHSLLFTLDDQRRGIRGEFRALVVRHMMSESENRTFISYGKEYSKF